MFRRILVAGWAFIFGSVALLGLFPRLVPRLPRPESFLFLFAFVLLSLVYGVFWLYRQGMKRQRQIGPLVGWTCSRQVSQKVENLCPIPYSIVDWKFLYLRKSRKVRSTLESSSAPIAANNSPIRRQFVETELS